MSERECKYVFLDPLLLVGCRSHLCGCFSEAELFLMFCSFITELYHKPVSYKHIVSHACSQPSSFKSPHATLLHLLQVIFKTKMEKVLVLDLQILKIISGHVSLSFRPSNGIFLL